MREFVSKEAYEQFIESDHIKLSDARDFFKRRGNLVYTGSNSELNKHTSTLIFGNRTMNDLEKEIVKKKYVVCRGFILKTGLSLDDLKDEISSVCETEKPATSRRPKFTGISISEDSLKGSFGYLSRRNSQVNIFDTAFKDFEFRVKALGSEDEENIYTVYTFSNFKTAKNELEKLIDWALDDFSTDIKSISFKKIEDTESRHNLLSEAIDNITNYELNGIYKWDADEAEDISGEDESDMFTRDVQDVGATTKTISANELTSKLEEIGKSCYRLQLNYYDEDNEEGIMYNVKDQGDLTIELRAINAISDISEVETINEFYNNYKRIIGHYEDYERKEITESYFLSMTKKIYQDIMS